MTNWLTDGWPHMWLPYAQMQTAPIPLPVVNAQGCDIELADGTRLIDGIASWWSMAHGYQHPQIVSAIAEQANQLSHVMFAGLAHEPAYKLASSLVSLMPNSPPPACGGRTGGGHASAEVAPTLTLDLEKSMDTHRFFAHQARKQGREHTLNRVFFADSGSIAVEVALKMALQYWANKGRHKKIKIIGMEHGYHGDTFGAMAVSSRGGFHKAYDGMSSMQYHLPIPSDEYGVAEFTETIAAIHGEVAALIIEPLVQGAGGFKFHSADILAEIRRVCREHEILFIADEIMTGFYRTGSRFACDEAGITPDILCLGKALTGGHINLGATLATETIFEAFLSDSTATALMHGPTFMANPLACAAANASLELFAAHPYEAMSEAIEAQLRAALEPLRALHGVLDVRVKGAIGVVQIDAAQEDMFALRSQFIAQGVWLRPFNDCVYVLPPLTISAAQLTQICEAVNHVICAWSRSKK